MSDHDEILTLINTTHEDLKEIIKSEVGGITQRLDKLNGTVAKLQEDNIKGHKMAADFRRLESSMLSVKKKWFYYVTAAIVFVVIVILLYDIIGISGIYDLLTTR